MSKKVKEARSSVSTSTSHSQQKIAKTSNRMRFVYDSRTGFVTRKEE